MYFNMCFGAAKAHAHKMIRSGWMAGEVVDESKRDGESGGLYQCCPEVLSAVVGSPMFKPKGVRKHV